MRAAVMRNWQLSVEEVADPRPGPGQVLGRVLACGICGSDLHMLRHGAEHQRLMAEIVEGQDPDPMQPKGFDPANAVIMGHEFCCEVVELGAGCSIVAVGDIVVSIPGAFDASGVHTLGYSDVYPGGYAEQMVLNDALAIRVPNGLPPRLAALTEPLAVGIHAVNKSRIGTNDAALVLGCGPVGLAVIVALKMKGVGPIVAADFSPKRRALAEHLGADVVVDPRQTPAIDAWRQTDGTRQLVIFEAVGVPGMIGSAMRMAPKDTRIVVVGACMQSDQIHPMVGLVRELNVQFVLAYEPGEFETSLMALADGKVDVESLLTGSVDIDQVPQAFVDLDHPETHAKILVEPGSPATN